MNILYYILIPAVILASILHPYLNPIGTYITGCTKASIMASIGVNPDALVAVVLAAPITVSVGM